MWRRWDRARSSGDDGEAMVMLKRYDDNVEERS